ncbi:MAG: 6-phosphogluconolactonase [Isosphaeraceae bacterium]
MSPPTRPTPVTEFQVDQLRVLVFEDRPSMGKAAAVDVAQAMAARKSAAGRVNMIFAAAPSQNEFLDGLADDPSVDWSCVYGFHMDEYLGLGPDHPASFRLYLQNHIFQRVGLPADRLYLVPGEQSDRPLKTCLEYEELLLKSPTDIVCAGIGENGHLAFNDPPVADFLDPVLIKVVRLDEPCRIQQVHDGCFKTIDDVPTHAYTLTVPALLKAPVVSVVVPGPRKADAVRDTLKGPIRETCPASALRNHAGARLYLDRDSARYVI